MPVHTPPPLASRSEWLSARASLAGRRSVRFAAGAFAVFVVVLLVLMFGPSFGPSKNSAPAARAQADTLALSRHADSAHRADVHGDSNYSATLLASEYLGADRAGMTATQRNSRDSLQKLATELDSLIGRAVNAPLPASYRALAAATALRGDTRTARLTDSLNALEKRRAALGPTNGADLPFADLTALVNDVGAAIRDAATRRRGGLARSIGDLDAAASGTVPAIDTAGPKRLRDSVHTAALAADSALATARVQNAAADRLAAQTRETENKKPPPIAMLVAGMLLAVIVGFAVNLSAEMNNPTLATPREAERVASAPILAVARDTDRTPRIGGIDPFRMLYLGLTATGTRMRTVVVSGDDRAVAATVGGRLALAAAADARVVLIVDADAEGSSVAGFYGQRPEPGFTDALAGVRLWREVMYPIGASDGLSIDVVPGGAIRREELDSATQSSAREEFALFCGNYDFCVIVAPSEAALELIASLVEKPVAVLCAEIARTAIARVRADAAVIRNAGAALHGLAIWDAELPVLRSRGELMTKTLAPRASRPAPEA